MLDDSSPGRCVVSGASNGPPFPSGFGDEFDQAAWDEAGRYADAQLAKWKHADDIRLAKVAAVFIVVLLLAFVVLAVLS